mgnify:CR=1 FL=1
MVGRRGFIQAAFTTKELRGLTSIKDVEYYLVKEELESSMNEQSLIELQGMSSWMIYIWSPLKETEIR